MGIPAQPPRIGVLAIIAARAQMGGDADDLLRRIIQESNSQPPVAA